MKRQPGETAIHYAQRLNHTIASLRNEEYRNYADLRKELLVEWRAKAKGAGDPVLTVNLDGMARESQDWQQFGLKGEAHKNCDETDSWHGYVEGKLSGLAKFLFKECKTMDPLHADDLLQEAVRDHEYVTTGTHRVRAVDREAACQLVANHIGDFEGSMQCIPEEDRVDGQRVDEINRQETPIAAQEQGDSGDVTCELRLNFTNLRAQKVALLEAMASSKKPREELLDGLLSLLDSVQDQAAKVHSEKMVFGDLDEEQER
jgi:hypothetical protein